MPVDTPACDPTRCPLCGQPNQCAMACGIDGSNCWCASVRIAPQTLARIPPALRGVACLCPKCAAAAPQAQHDPRARN
ncbi:cysteine-rich CWC family protein [Thiomonas sp.]